jgi:WD40 repeat protein
MIISINISNFDWRKAILLPLFLTLFSVSLTAQTIQLALQTGHTGKINSLSFTQNGKLMASAGIDKTILLWDMEVMKQIKILSFHTGEVHSVDFHPTLPILASGAEGGELIIYDYAQDTILMEYRDMDQAVRSVSFSPDGNGLAYGTNSVHILTLENWQEYELNVDSEGHLFTHVIYSNTGRFLAIGSEKGSIVNVLDTKSNEIISRVHISPMQMLFSDEDEFLVIGGRNGSFKKLSLDTKFSMFDNFHIGSNRRRLAVNSMAISEDFIIAGGKNKLISVYKKRGGRKTDVYKAHEDEVTALAVFPNQDFLVSGGKKGELFLWNLQNGKLEMRLEGISGAITDIEFVKENSLLISHKDGTTKILDLSDLTKTFQFTHPEKVVKSSFVREEHRIDYTRYIDEENVLLKTTSFNGEKEFSLDYTDFYETIYQWNPVEDQINEVAHTRKSAYHRLFLQDKFYLKWKLKGFHAYIYDAGVKEFNIGGEKKRGYLVYRMYEDNFLITAINVSESGDSFLSVSKDLDNERALVNIYSREEGFLFEKEVPFEVSHAGINGLYFYIIADQKATVFNMDGEKMAALQTNSDLFFDLDGDMLYYIDTDNLLTAYSMPGFEKSFSVTITHNDLISDITTSQELSYLATASYDGTIKFYDLLSGEEQFTLAEYGLDDYIILLKDNTYMASKDAAREIGFQSENKFYPFEQFDLKYNRPDLILAEVGIARGEIIDAYHSAYQKRLKKSGFKEEDLGEEIHLPETEVLNFVSTPIVTAQELELNISIKDTRYLLDRYNIWINDVPLFGTKGKSIRGQGFDSLQVNEKVVLSSGLNKIQVSCHNERGIESYKETKEITFNPGKSLKPDLYYIAISTSKYEQSQYNLKYAVKDGTDLANQFAGSEDQFDQIYIDTLFNENATLENISKLKSKLYQTKVDDQVVLFISGHGLLDKNLDFYFATYNIDFENPSQNGISYDLLEGLLDSIPARKKLFMMDACHSGEVDKDELIVSNTVTTKDGLKSGVNTYTYRAKVLQLEDEDDLGLQNSFELMQEYFTNLNRSSGAVVISAAAGDSYAMESDVWNNGVFTYAIINGLNSHEADLNKNKEVSVSELREFVIDNVVELTGGKQKPTCRQDNLGFDFRIW